MKKIISIFCLFSPFVVSIYSMTETNAQMKFQQDTSLERNPIIYNSGNSFQKFLNWSDEKQKGADAILSVIGEKRGSFLDIGAGNGMITKRLESNFNHITVVEPSSQLFEILKNKCSSDKYTLLNAPFEQTDIQKKFDVILTCHSLKFIPNPGQAIEKIKNLLNDSGVYILIDHAQESGFLNFYNTYSGYVLKESKTDTVFIDYTDLLSKSFDVKKIIFTATHSIPSVDDAISILDFIYDVEWSKISKESLTTIKQALTQKYGAGKIDLAAQQCLYLCTKKISNKETSK